MALVPKPVFCCDALVVFIVFDLKMADLTSRLVAIGLKFKNRTKMQTSYIFYY
jgi:hypothetical protein